MNQLIVDVTNERLDIYLSNALSLSRTYIKDLITLNLVTVNEKQVKPSFKVTNGDVIKYTLKPEDDTTVKAVNMNLEILYEDKYLAVVVKPKGIVVHPAKGHYENTLVSGLMYELNELSDLDDVRPGIVHRLDKDTSGLLVIAKDNKTHQLLSDLFSSREVKKYYYAITIGVVLEDNGVIDAPIKRDLNNRQKMSVLAGGKESITNFKVLRRFKEHTLLDVELVTGRTHQIRVHLAYINKPVLGDNLYGPKKAFGDLGQYLHAYRLIFRHPITGDMIDLKTDIPDYMLEVLSKLES